MHEKGDHQIDRLCVEGACAQICRMGCFSFKYNCTISKAVLVFVFLGQDYTQLDLEENVLE